MQGPALDNVMARTRYFLVNHNSKELGCSFPRARTVPEGARRAKTHTGSEGVRTWPQEHKTQACPLRAPSKFSPSLSIISLWRVRSGWWTTAATTAPTAAFHVGLGVAKTKSCKHVMFLPLGGGLLESSIDSFSCCMNSPPYTLRSCQMFSNLSKGFLQPSSASLPRKDEKIYIYKLKFLFLIRTDLFKKTTTTTTAKMIYILKTKMRYTLYYLESQILTETAFLPWWVGKRHPITQGILFPLEIWGNRKKTLYDWF